MPKRPLALRPRPALRTHPAACRFRRPQPARAATSSRDGPEQHKGLSVKPWEKVWAEFSARL